MVALAFLSGCMTLDWAVFTPTTTDRYELDFGVDEQLVELVEFSSADGTQLYGAWVRQPEPSTPLIFFHGKTNHIDGYAERIGYYWTWGYDVFVFDYRGFGRSEGEATEEGVLSDGIAAVAYVSEATGVKPSEIPWVTLSLGSSVAVHANAEVDASAVILESMFASADAVLDDSVGLDLPQEWFMTGTYDNVEGIARMRAPVLLIHGRDDDFIPPKHVETLYEAAPDNPKALWRPEGVGHADLYEVLPGDFEARALDWFADR